MPNLIFSCFTFTATFLGTFLTCEIVLYGWSATLDACHPFNFVALAVEASIIWIGILGVCRISRRAPLKPSVVRSLASASGIAITLHAVDLFA
jgi:arginine exporter protein ArgO